MIVSGNDIISRKTSVTCTIQGKLTDINTQANPHLPKRCKVTVRYSIK